MNHEFKESEWMNMSKGTFWLGALIGGAAAYTAAMLYAPKSGDELQEELKEKADRTKEMGKDYYSIARDKSGDVKAVLQDASKDVSVSFKEASNKIASQARVDGPILKGNLQGLKDKNSMSKELLKANLKAAAEDVKITAGELKKDLSDVGNNVKIYSGELAKQSKQEIAEIKEERQDEREYDLYQEAFEEELDLENTFKE